ncbi:MAG: ABC transporter ATPase [Flavobacteriales bacterium]|nr:ABC transporter ATPase [Flavobacteriales bacterium]NQX96616.1 ABC transporter ATPase [Flavobacteriales bacterium]
MEYINYPDNAKVWIYQSNKHFDADEIAYLKVQLDEFTSDWESHGELLTGTAELFYDLFVVFFVDEQGDAMCGRAQDASVNFMKKLEGELEVTFLDRMVQSYKKGDKVEVVRMADYEGLIENKEIDENTIVYNNMVTTKIDFDNHWEVPMKNSWHKQLLV